MNYSQEIREIFNGFKTNETIFLSDNQFTEKEIQIFSDKDKLSIWEPDGVPFCGDFDNYIKVFKSNEFKGFYRVEVFPWGEINLHIAFPTSESLISRYYLKTTREFLNNLIPLSKKVKIYCVFRPSNTNVLKYMTHFKFPLEKTTTELHYFKFNLE